MLCALSSGSFRQDRLYLHLHIYSVLVSVTVSFIYSNYTTHCFVHFFLLIVDLIHITVTWGLTLKCLWWWIWGEQFSVSNLENAYKHIPAYSCLCVCRYCLHILDQRLCSSCIATDAFGLKLQYKKAFVTIVAISDYVCLQVHFSIWSSQEP